VKRQRRDRRTDVIGPYASLTIATERWSLGNEWMLEWTKWTKWWSDRGEKTKQSAEACGWLVYFTRNRDWTSIPRKWM